LTTGQDFYDLQQQQQQEEQQRQLEQQQALEEQQAQYAPEDPDAYLGEEYQYPEEEYYPEEAQTYPEEEQMYADDYQRDDRQPYAPEVQNYVPAGDEPHDYADVSNYHEGYSDPEGMAGTYAGQDQYGAHEDGYDDQYGPDYEEDYYAADPQMHAAVMPQEGYGNHPAENQQMQTAVMPQDYGGQPPQNQQMRTAVMPQEGHGVEAY